MPSLKSCFSVACVIFLGLLPPGTLLNASPAGFLLFCIAFTFLGSYLCVDPGLLCVTNADSLFER